jgi:hypothetical protein
MLDPSHIREDYTMDLMRQKKIEGNLGALVVRQIGRDSWTRLLGRLADAEERMGGPLRRWPRNTQQVRVGTDQCHPLLFFAPDRDREGREYAAVVDGDLVYREDSMLQKHQVTYRVCSDDDLQWWRGLSDRQKGVVIWALCYMLHSAGSLRRAFATG